MFSFFDWEDEREYGWFSDNGDPEPEEDPYQAKEMSCVEEFYEEYRDEFSCFEDAEDYYNEHT